MKSFYSVLSLMGIGTAALCAGVFLAPPKADKAEKFSELKSQPGSAMFVTQRDINPLQSKARANDDDPTAGFPIIYGNMVYDDAWEDIQNYEDIPFGIYSFAANEAPAPKPKVTSSELEGTAGCILDGKYYFIVPEYNMGGTIDGGTMYVYNLSDWSVSTRKTFDINMNAGALAFQMATDHVKGIIYTVSFSDDATSYVFGTFNPTTMKRTVIGPCEYYHALAVDNDGTVYGINLDSELVRFDTQTGAATVIGDTGVDILYQKMSGTIDPQSGIFYWAAYCNKANQTLYMVDKSSGRASKVGDFKGGKEFVGLAIAPEDVDDNAPARAGSISLDFKNGSLQGNLSFTAPTLTFGGKTLSGNLTANIKVDGKETATATMAPGETKTMPLEVAEEGLHTVSVNFTNEAGTGPSNATSYYFGLDVPAEVVEPMLTNEKGVATLLWDAPEAGLHNGYIDPSTFSYNITKIIQDKETVVATGLTATEFSEKIDTDEIITVRYRITALSNGREGASVVSDRAVFGEAFNAPVTWMLDDPDEFDLFTAIDANGDGFSWESGTWRYTQNKTIYAQNMWNDDDVTDADDWFISPKVRLEPGRRYYFKFSAANTMLTKREIFEVKMGGEATLDGMTTTIQDPVTLETSDDWYRIRIPVEVEQAGNYNFGIHCISKAPDYYRLYVDTIAVEAGPHYMAPTPVKDLTITPAAKAALKANLSFTLPDTRVNGDKLESISFINVYRGTRDGVELVETIKGDFKPGQKYEYLDKSPKNGFNTYRVCAGNEYGEGEIAEAEEYIGLDQPNKVENVRVKVEADNVQLSWDPVSEIGWKGGYVDPKTVVYDVFDGIDYVFPVRGYDDTTFALGNPNEGRQRSQFWIVNAYNEIGRADGGVSPRYIQGKTYDLPFVEEFTNGRTDNPYWFSGESSLFVSSGWRLGVDETTNGVMQYQGGGSGAFNSIYPGPVDFTNAFHPVITFDVASVTGTGNKLSVWVSTGTAKDFEKVADVELTNKMKTQTIDLSAYKGYPRVCVEFYCESNANGASIVFDNINIYDQLNNDLGIASVSAPQAVNYDGTAKITATVANFGKSTVRDYSVNLYKDGKTLLKSIEGQPIEAGKKADFTFEYAASIEDPEEVRLHVEIDYADDEYPDDDASDPIVIAVVKPEAPAVDNLVLNDTPEGFRLDWSRPEYADGYPAREVSDDMERYIDFAISDIGRWTMYDEDGEYVYALGGLGDYPNMYGPAAYYVFNPSVLGVKGPSNISAHSGDKYLLAFSPQSGNAANDWLFSPELSGDAQTISFFVKPMQEDINETYIVYYSTTEPTVESAVKAKTGVAKGGWTEVTVNLPAGAKYFAIRYASNGGAAIMIDDITYKAAPMDAELTFVGYNVYGDGKKLNETPITETSFLIPANSGDIFYVTAVYVGVESAPSNQVGISGVDTIETGMEYEGPAFDLQGRPVREGSRGDIIIRQGKKIIVTK